MEILKDLEFNDKKSFHIKICETQQKKKKTKRTL